MNEGLQLVVLLASPLLLGLALVLAGGLVNALAAIPARTVWAAVMVAGVGLAGLGASNLNAHSPPNLYRLPEDPEAKKLLLSIYERERVEVGRGAVIPKVYCLPLLLVGVAIGLLGFVKVVD